MKSPPAEYSLKLGTPTRAWILPGRAGNEWRAPVRYRGEYLGEVWTNIDGLLTLNDTGVGWMPFPLARYLASLLPPLRELVVIDLERQIHRMMTDLTCRAKWQ